MCFVCKGRRKAVLSPSEEKTVRRRAEEARREEKRQREEEERATRSRSRAQEKGRATSAEEGHHPGEEEVAEERGPGEASNGNTGSRDSGGTNDPNSGSGGSSGGRGRCWLVLALLLIVAIAGGLYYYWSTSQEVVSEPVPTPTPTVRAIVGETPTPTAVPAAATATPTSVPCADPTPTPSPTATPVPTATPTPDWPPAPLSDAWREWVPGWSRQQANDALKETTRDFNQVVDSLKDLPPSEACPLVGELETRLAVAEYVVEVHRLENENVPGQPAGNPWKVWLLNRGEVLADTALAHVSLAECRGVLATPTPMPMPTATAMPHGAPLPPCPTATPMPLPTATPTATATPLPTPTSRPRATATPRPTTTPTPQPSPTATPEAHTSEQRLSPSELQALRLFVLELINKDRADHGLQPVTLGLNPAAQLHAEDMLEHNYSGHWWVDGRDPAQVYSETGGTSYAQENTVDWGCVSLTNCRLAPPRDAVVRLQQSLMGSPGHRRNILKPAHGTLSIGIAYDGMRYTLAQIFGGGAAEADAQPSLSPSGVLTFSLTKREPGLGVHGTVTVYYTPPNAPLTPNEIDRLNDGECINGVGFIESCNNRVALIIEPALPGYSYSNLGPDYVEADRLARDWFVLQFHCLAGEPCYEIGGLYRRGVQG